MIPQFATHKELHDWLRVNKGTLLAAKRATIKRADPIAGGNILPAGMQPNAVVKALGGAAEAPAGGILYAKSVINTTNLLDSHGDVHIPGLWKKTLNEKKEHILLQEHRTGFKDVISDEVDAYTKTMTWKSLGFDYEGSTQALIFDSTIRATRNEFMFDQYASGYVKNHSVGMRYGKIILCVNSEEKYWAEERDAYEKYLEQVANKEAAEEAGIFWAVTEAQIIEGSAVLFGSNWATPTLEISEAGKSATSDFIEPAQATQPQQKRSRFSKMGSKTTS